MAIKIFLGLNALIFVGYGLYCLAVPSVIADQTGMQLATGVATTEVRAMYGGLQTAIGLLALAGILRPAVQPAALLVLAFLLFGLASGRMVGIVLDTDPGTYNFAAVAFEATFAAIAAGLLVKSSAPTTRPA
jgi:hypothetical protein